MPPTGSLFENGVSDVDLRPKTKSNKSETSATKENTKAKENKIRSAFERYKRIYESINPSKSSLSRLIDAIGYCEISTEFHSDGSLNGILIRNIADDSPALKAGLKNGDIVKSINGLSVCANDLNGISRRFKHQLDSESIMVIERNGISIPITFMK